MQAATFVGSRESLLKYAFPMMTIAYTASESFVCRSGRAPGPDQWAQLAYILRYYASKVCHAEIYVPDNQFCNQFVNTFTKCNSWTYTQYDMKLWDEARDIARTIHEAWHNCSSFAKVLHTRNVFQVLGPDLNTPSKFCVFCANQVDNDVFGGTRTAVELCRRYDVPNINIRLKGPEAVSKFLDKYGLEYDYTEAKLEVKKAAKRLKSRNLFDATVVDKYWSCVR